jgi:ubiquitin conjugation factor E4 B
LIDLQFFFKTSRLNISGQTRLNCELEYAKEVMDKYKEANPTPQTPNFISEIFFMTLAYQHYGHMSTLRFYNRFVREVDDMQRNGKRHVEARENGSWVLLDEATRNANEQGIIRLQTELDKLFGYKLSMEAGLLDVQMIDQTIRFYNLTIAWLLKCATGDPNENTPWRQIIKGESDLVQLFPIKGNTKEFQTLPEYILEDMLDFYVFILKHSSPAILEGKARDEVVTFAMVLLYNNSLVKNPYLKAKLVEILWVLSSPVEYTGLTELTIDHEFVTHKWAREYLVHVLIQFYIDIEQTGRSSQFYDKFNTRYNISQTLKHILKKEEHKKKLHELAATHSDLFVRFAALVNNDVTFLMDEALGKITEVASIQRAIEEDDGMDHSAAASQRRMERDQNLASNERHAQTYASLSKEALSFLGRITQFKNVRAPFLSPEIVGRFTAMLDYNIVRLSGPKCIDLKVNNPQKYYFDPKKLLSIIFEVYVNFGPDCTTFVEAIAKDGRSFSKEIFMAAANIINRFQLCDPVLVF